jgi:hypothetical protein
MQNQQAAQESLLTIAQIPYLELSLVGIILILLVAFLLLVRHAIRNRPGVGSASVPQGEQQSWLDYGNLFAVFSGIGAVIIGFLLTLLLLGRFEDGTQALGFLTAYFGAIVGLIGTYFGIKSSSDAAKGAQSLVAAPSGDTTPPRILSFDPPDQAPDVPPDIHLTATFSEDMDPATIDPNTFKLLDQVTLQQVAGGVAYDVSTREATFNPAAALQNGRLYAATITASVKDKAGNALAADHTWHFKVANGGQPTAKQERTAEREPTTEQRRQGQPRDE